MPNTHRWKELLRWLLWNRNWNSTKTSKAELERIIQEYKTLSRDFLAKDLLSWEIYFTFHTIDNPMMNEQLFDLIESVENTLKKFPEFWALTAMWKDELSQLMIEYSKLFEFASNQLSYFSWTYTKYRHATDYLFEVLSKEASEKNEKIYLDFLKTIPIAYEKTMRERDREIRAVEEKFKEKKKKLEDEYDELINDNQATNAEKKNALKNLKDDENFEIKNLIDLFKVKADEERDRLNWESNFIKEKTKNEESNLKFL